jgi:O-antigen ligase
MIVLPLGHVTGLRNTLAILTIVATLSIHGTAAIAALPARKTLLAFTIWALLSLFWSVDTGASWSKLRSDWLLPVAGYVAAYLYCREPQRLRQVVVGALTGLVLLAVVSLFAWLPAGVYDSWISEEAVALIARPMPLWYPGVGDASMIALLCLGPGLALLAHAAWRRSVWPWAVAIAFVLVILIAQNRNSIVVAPLCLLAFFWVRRRALSEGAIAGEPAPGISGRWVALLVLAAMVASAAILEVSSHARLSATQRGAPPWGEAAIEMALRDPRPQIWQEYARLGSQNALLGVGFGRTLASEAYHTREDTVLTTIDLAARSHAHNVFVNIWLQLGWIGLALYVSIWVAMVAELRARWRPTPQAALWMAGWVALALGALMRELTDDFLVFGTASAFWCLSGALLAQAGSRSR